jgi:hypothetical protein
MSRTGLGHGLHAAVVKLTGSIVENQIFGQQGSKLIDLPLRRVDGILSGDI